MGEFLANIPPFLLWGLVIHQSGLTCVHDVDINNAQNAAVVLGDARTGFGSRFGRTNSG